MKPLVLYHADCADGMAAAWAAWSALGDGAEYRPVRYSDPVPADAAGRHVILLDFVFNRSEQLSELLGLASSLLVLDHHSGAEGMLRQFVDVPVGVNTLRYDGHVGGKPVSVVFDTSKSGARLAWEQFHPGRRVPALVLYVEDRDLWRFALPNSDAVNAYVSTAPYALEAYAAMAKEFDAGSLLNGHLTGGPVVAAGARVAAYRDQLAARIADRAQLIRFQGYHVYCAAAPVLWSEACGLLADGVPFGMSFRLEADGTRAFDLRRRASFGEPLDMSVLAKAAGGGGHKAAAGFQVKPGEESPTLKAWPPTPRQPGMTPLAVLAAVRAATNRALADGAKACDHRDPTVCLLVDQNLKLARGEAPDGLQTVPEVSS